MDFSHVQMQTGVIIAKEPRFKSIQPVLISNVHYPDLLDFFMTAGYLPHSAQLPVSMPTKYICSQMNAVMHPSEISVAV